MNSFHAHNAHGFGLFLVLVGSTVKGGSGVLVGGLGVLVGGSCVGGLGVSVDGTGELVGGTRVADGFNVGEVWTAVGVSVGRVG
jgi:hypothetical protein